MFTPRGFRPETSVRISRHVGPFDRMRNNALSVRSRNTIRRVASDPALAKSFRQKSIRTLLKISSELYPIRVKLRPMLPDNSPSRELSIPSIGFLSQKTDYHGKSITSDLDKGMDIIGDAPITNAPGTRSCCAITDVRDIKQRLLPGNRTILRDLKRDTGKALVSK